MALTKAAVTILASTTAAAGTSKASPGATGSSIDVRAYYGGELTWKITNGSAPGVAATFLFQSSQDGTNWYDYHQAGGNTTASDVTSGTVQLGRGIMYIRAIAYGNTTNSVTVEAYLQAVTAL